MNKLLKRQIRKYFGENFVIPQNWELFLKAVEEAYDHYENDRKLTQRSLEISSRELREANEKVQAKAEEHRAVLMRLVGFVISLRQEGEVEIPQDSLLVVADHLEKQIRQKEFYAQELKRNQENLRALIENTQDAIWSVDKDLKLIISNSQFSHSPFVVNQPKEGESLSACWQVDTWPQIEQLHRKSLEGNRLTFEFPFEVSQEIRFYEISLNPIFSEKSILGVTVFCKDATEKRQAHNLLIQAKELAERANRMKSEFLANVSHELRTPLNAIIGYSEILQEELEASPSIDTMKSDAMKIHTAGKHLLSLIDEILDLSVIEAGQFDLTIEEIDVVFLLRDIQLVCEPLMASNKNQLIVAPSEGIGFIETDETKLRQILLNLVTNAAKFTLNGQISLTAYSKKNEENEWVVFEVKDTGIGIPEERVEQIFEHFTQLDSGPTRKVGGIGIGLSICKRLSELLGGEIKVVSRIGEGSIFSLELPRTFRPPKFDQIHHFIRFAHES